MAGNEAEFKARLQAETAQENPAFAERLAAEQAGVQPPNLQSPVLWGIGGAGGALAGSRMVQAYEQGQLRELARQAKVHVPEEVLQQGRNAVINYIKAMHTGDINYVGGESYKEAHAMTEEAKAKAASAPSGFKYDFESGQYIPEAEYNARQEQRNIREKARIAAELKNKPFAERLEAKSPATSRAVSGVGNVLKKGFAPPFIEHSLAGYYGGQSAAEAINRAAQKDVPGAAISGAGSVGAALTLSKNPKLRAIGLGLMGLSYGADKMYDSTSLEGPGPLETIQSVVNVDKKAAGGLATPAWQRKEGQNPEGGLNAAGRASYHAETGGTLKPPQPEGGKRKDAFCKRMKGMKKKLTSAETAKDPDSRINKSLRAWNC